MEYVHSANRKQHKWGLLEIKKEKSRQMKKVIRKSQTIIAQ